MTSSIVDAKRAVRLQVRRARQAMSTEARALAREQLTARLIEVVQTRAARSLSCFMPTPLEPDTRDFLAWARQQRIDTLLPVSLEDGRLEWVVANADPRTQPTQATQAGRFGIEEPIGERLDSGAVGRVDLMFIPAAGVDKFGTRIGWGRGYFDRCIAALEARPPIYAVVFDHEFVDHLPRESHDIPVTGVVTPERVIDI